MEIKLLDWIGYPHNEVTLLKDIFYTHKQNINQRLIEKYSLNLDLCLEMKVSDRIDNQGFIKYFCFYSSELDAIIHIEVTPNNITTTLRDVTDTYYFFKNAYQIPTQKISKQDLEGTAIVYSPDYEMDYKKESMIEFPYVFYESNVHYYCPHNGKVYGPHAKWNAMYELPDDLTKEIVSNLNTYVKKIEK